LIGIGAATAQPADETDKPNFVILMADDMGYGEPSSYGNDDYDTPRIDQLAEEGIRFTDFHSNGAVCSPRVSNWMRSTFPRFCWKGKT
jgi:arylsulfatase A-like enzyme